MMVAKVSGNGSQVEARSVGSQAPEMTCTHALMSMKTSTDHCHFTAGQTNSNVNSYCLFHTKMSNALHVIISLAQTKAELSAQQMTSSWQPRIAHSWTM